MKASTKCLICLIVCICKAASFHKLPSTLLHIYERKHQAGCVNFNKRAYGKLKFHSTVILVSIYFYSIIRKHFQWVLSMPGFVTMICWCGERWVSLKAVVSAFPFGKRAGSIYHISYLFLWSSNYGVPILKGRLEQERNSLSKNSFRIVFSPYIPIFAAKQYCELYLIHVVKGAVDTIGTCTRGAIRYLSHLHNIDLVSDT